MAILRAYHFMHPICTKGIHERQHQRNFAKVNEITTLDLSESRSQMRIFYKNLQRLIMIMASQRLRDVVVPLPNPVTSTKMGDRAMQPLAKGFVSTPELVPQIFQKRIEFTKGTRIGQGRSIVATQLHGMLAKQIDFAADC